MISILLKNQKFIRPTDLKLRNFKLDDDINGCIHTREEIELLINRELTTPEEIMTAHSEAMRPNHAAISLDGEPLLYPRISEYIQEFRDRKMTSFVVTNGTLPEKMSELDTLPSQIYIEPASALTEFLASRRIRSRSISMSWIVLSSVLRRIISFKRSVSECILMSLTLYSHN